MLLTPRLLLLYGDLPWVRCGMVESCGGGEAGAGMC